MLWSSMPFGIASEEYKDASPSKPAQMSNKKSIYVSLNGFCVVVHRRQPKCPQLAWLLAHLNRKHQSSLKKFNERIPFSFDLPKAADTFSTPSGRQVRHVDIAYSHWPIKCV